MVLLTGGALLVGAVIVAFIIATNQPASPGNGSVPTTLSAPFKIPPANLADGRTLGSANAPVTLDIWSDFQCPACDAFATDTEPSVVEDFVVPGTLKIVYHDAAFQGAKSSSPWDESVQAASAARCAGDQGKFWDFHAWLFANREGENVGSFTKDRLRAIAEKVGLNLTTYDACMNDGAKQAAVKKETSDAMAVGIDSTPTLSINGQRQVGALTYNQIAQLIQAATSSPAASSSASPGN